MVNLPPEIMEALMGKKSNPHVDPGLSEYDRRLLGAPMRIEIPLEDVFQLRKIMDELAAVASRASILLREPEMSDLDKLRKIQWDILAFRRKNALLRRKKTKPGDENH